VQKNCSSSLGPQPSDLPAFDVVEPQHAGAVVAGGVRSGEEREAAVVVDRERELPHRTHGLMGAVATEAVASHELHADEGVAVETVGPPQHTELGPVVAPVAHARDEASVVEAEHVVGAACDGEVALGWVEGALEHAQALHEPLQDEVRVGEAVPVRVGGFVQRDAVERELHVLPLACVEAAQEDARRVPFAAVVGEHAGRAPG
jgi:hypothetical protein